MYTRCKERPRPLTIYTFRDTFHETGLHEDVWRLGLTILDIIESIQLSRAYHRGRPHDHDSGQSLPGTNVMEECKYSEQYPSQHINDLVKYVCQKASATYANDESYGPSAHTLFSQIRTSLTQMLHKRVDARPSVAKLLQSLPWRVCANMKHPPKYQRRSYRPLQRLTSLQRSRKASLVDLNTVKLHIPEATSSNTPTLGEDWKNSVVASSAYRKTSAKSARRRLAPRRRRPIRTHKHRARVALSASSASSASSTTTAYSTAESKSSLAQLPRTREAIRKRYKSRRQRH